MRFGRLMAATGVVSFAAAGGLYMLAPAAYGQPAPATSRGEQGTVTTREAERKVDRVVIAGGGQNVRRRIETMPAMPLGEDLVMFDGGGSRIGVAVRDVETADVTRQKLPAQAGAVVEEVRRETAASKAGVKTSDIIVSFDGERVRSARQLERLVEETPAGRAVKMSVMRDGAKVDLDVTPESAMPPSAAAFTFDRAMPDMLGPKIRARARRAPLASVDSVPAMPFEFDEGSFAFGRPRSRLGVEVDGVDDQLASYFGVEGGLLVRHVAENSPAAKAGLKAGDVITAIAGKPVTEPEELRANLEAVADGKEVTLAVTREKKAMSVKATIEVPEKSRPRLRRTI